MHSHILTYTHTHGNLRQSWLVVVGGRRSDCDNCISGITRTSVDHSEPVGLSPRSSLLSFLGFSLVFWLASRCSLVAWLNAHAACLKLSTHQAAVGVDQSKFASTDSSNCSRCSVYLLLGETTWSYITLSAVTRHFYHSWQLLSLSPPASPLQLSVFLLAFWVKNYRNS